MPTYRIKCEAVQVTGSRTVLVDAYDQETAASLAKHGFGTVEREEVEVEYTDARPEDIEIVDE